MRIAVFHDLPSGGAKRTLHDVLKRLAVRHAIDVYALSTADEQFGDLRPLVRAYHQVPYAPSPLLASPFGRLNALRRWRDLGRLVELSRRLAATIDAAGYDVVLAEPSMWTQAPPLLLSLATPAVYDLHEPPRAFYEPNLNRRSEAGWRRVANAIDPLAASYRARAMRLDRAATRAARRVLANSHFTADRARAIYGVEARVAYHGVDVERFRPPDGAPRRDEVLSVGALQPSKGFDFLVRAVAAIPPAARPRLRLVGNAEAVGERAFLTRLAADLGVALEIEIGVDDAHLARRYAEAAIFAYAPHREPFGLAPLEAMACATPVVAVAEGGIPESVQPGVTGVLVEREVALFAEALGALLADPPRQRSLGAAGRAGVCAHWTWERASEQLERELAAVAGDGSRR